MSESFWRLRGFFEVHVYEIFWTVIHPSFHLTVARNINCIVNKLLKLLENGKIILYYNTALIIPCFVRLFSASFRRLILTSKDACPIQIRGISEVTAPLNCPVKSKHPTRKYRVSKKKLMLFQIQISREFHCGTLSIPIGIQRTDRD